MKLVGDRQTDRPTDRPTDRRTDIVTYRAAIAAKKIRKLTVKTMTIWKKKNSVFFRMLSYMMSKVFDEDEEDKTLAV